MEVGATAIGFHDEASTAVFESFFESDVHLTPIDLHTGAVCHCILDGGRDWK